MVKYSYVTAFLWDAHFTVPTFDFYFKFQIPKPNRERVIVERDKLGRILTTKVQNISFANIT